MNSHALEHASDLDASDLRRLMAMEVSGLLGGLIHLNQEERYHHRLNVFVVLAELLELRERDVTEPRKAPCPVHRPLFPVRPERGDPDQRIV